MHYHFRFYKFLLLILDFFILYFSSIIAYYIRINKFPEENQIFGIMLFIFVGLFAFYLLELYNPWSTLTKMPIHYRSFIGVFVVLILYFFFSFFQFEKNPFFESKIIFIYFMFFIIPLVFFSRYFFNKNLDPDHLKIRWLMISNLENALEFQKEIHYRGGKWEIQYLLETDSYQKYITEKYSLQVIGDLQKDFHKIKEHKWTGIIIASRNLDYEKINLLINYKREGIPIYDLVYFYESFFYKIPLYYIDSSWFLLTRGFMIIANPIVIKIKYILDKIFAIFLIIFFSPVMLIVGLLIRIFDGFPIIFKQERLGLNNKPFIAYKFRTMIKDADKQNPYTQQKDQRVTKIGTFLRKTRLDELPQLFNVLKGDMSLIGPRAEWTKLTTVYEKEIKLYHIRHFVKPGLTGWAQVLYPYGASIQDTIHKLEYDLYYIKNYSILLDLVIIIKTIRVILFGSGR